VILLDTHAWIWWLAQPESLSEAAQTAVERAVADWKVGAGESGLAVSSISVWELAMLVDRRRLELTTSPASWVQACESLPFLSFVPVDNRVALRSVSLASAFHADPADRMIVATALVHNMTLVTKDERIRRHGLVPTIW